MKLAAIMLSGLLLAPVGTAGATETFTPMWEKAPTNPVFSMRQDLPGAPLGTFKLAAQQCYSTGCHKAPPSCAMFGPGFRDAGPVNCGGVTPFGRLCCRN